MPADAVTTAYTVIGLAALAFAFLSVTVSALVVALGMLAFRALARHWRRPVDDHDLGPDALTLLQHLDDHLDQVAASDPELAPFAPERRTP